MPNDSEQTPGQEKTARRRMRGRLFGVLLMAAAFLRFSTTSTDNPRVAMVHRVDILGLVTAGMLFGFGLALLVFRSE